CGHDPVQQRRGSGELVGGVERCGEVDRHLQLERWIVGGAGHGVAEQVDRWLEVAVRQKRFDPVADGDRLVNFERWGRLRVSGIDRPAATPRRGCQWTHEGAAWVAAVMIYSRAL